MTQEFSTGKWVDVMEDFQLTLGLDLIVKEEESINMLIKKQQKTFANDSKGKILPKSC